MKRHTVIFRHWSAGLSVGMRLNQCTKSEGHCLKAANVPRPSSSQSFGWAVGRSGPALQYFGAFLGPAGSLRLYFGGPWAVSRYFPTAPKVSPGRDPDGGLWGGVTRATLCKVRTTTMVQYICAAKNGSQKSSASLKRTYLLHLLGSTVNTKGHLKCHREF